MDRPYTLADIAQMTGITARTLRKHIACGVLCGKKRGGKWRYTVEEVGRYMDRPQIKKLAAQHRRACADDFLNARIKPVPVCLYVVDMPNAPETFRANLLAACRDVEMRYVLDPGTNMTRVTLVGAPDAVRKVLEQL